MGESLPVSNGKFIKAISLTIVLDRTKPESVRVRGAS